MSTKRLVIRIICLILIGILCLPILPLILALDIAFYWVFMIDGSDYLIETIAVLIIGAVASFFWSFFLYSICFPKYGVIH